MEQQSTVRLPRFADGRWYSADPIDLRTDIRAYLGNASQTTLPGPVVGLVAPHAGHFFSGHVAAAAFAALPPDAFNTVILLGPDHRGITAGRIAALRYQAWRTPLGDTPINWDMLGRLQNQFPLKLLSADNEHSLEIELPFLQLALTNFQLVPLLMGDQSAETCRQLAKAIVSALTASDCALLVASSDLSHFFDDSTARALDKATLQFALDMDPAGLLEHVAAGHRRREPLACGAGPIATVIHAAQMLGATAAHLIKYATSADAYAHADRNRVVGYAAVAFCRK